jgi:hypothetical protein
LFAPLSPTKVRVFASKTSNPEAILFQFFQDEHGGSLLGCDISPQPTSDGSYNSQLLA